MCCRNIAIGRTGFEPADPRVPNAMLYQAELPPDVPRYSHLPIPLPCGLPAMTVCTANVTFRHLKLNLRHGDAVINHTAYVILFDATNMIELQDDDIAFTAVYAAPLRQVVNNELFYRLARRLLSAIPAGVVQ